jgi:hypothetical protein
MSRNLVHWLPSRLLRTPALSSCHRAPVSISPGNSCTGARLLCIYGTQLRQTRRHSIKVKDERLPPRSSSSGCRARSRMQPRLVRRQGALLALLTVLLLSSLAQPTAAASATHELAIDLVERADGQKERALREAKRDVRREARREHPPAPPPRERTRTRSRDPHALALAVSSAVAPQRSRQQAVRRNYYHPDRDETVVVEHEWSEVFAWASNASDGTVLHTQTTVHVGNVSHRVFAPGVTVPAVHGAAPSASMLQLHEEAGVMVQALRELASATASSSARIRSLLVLEDLCHDVADADELHRAGGLRAVIEAMDDELDHVRASAAWALSTCTQNNPAMQNASVELGVLPVLLHLAAEDTADVCSRALLALNALLELNEARRMFEAMADAIEVLRRPLLELHDNPRATRRALTLAELLVQRNIAVWKAQLEALDLPRVVRDIMRNHKDFDVRVSAARVTLALDGYPPSNN